MRVGILVLPKSTSSRFPLYLTWLTFRYRGVTVTRTFHNSSVRFRDSLRGEVRNSDTAWDCNIKCSETSMYSKGSLHHVKATFGQIVQNIGCL